MNAGNEKVGPKIDLQLGMNYSNQCILKTDSRAGANAVSKLDMRFFANGPLSELVWSPDKGLSLKCADSSFADEKKSLFWDVGPSNFALGMPESIVGVTSTANRPTDGVFSKPIAAVCIKSDISGNDILSKDFTSDSGVKPECKEYEKQGRGSKSDMEEMSSTERNFHDQIDAGTAQISEANKEKVSTISGQIVKIQFDNLLPQADEREAGMEQNPLARDQTSGGGDMGVKNQAFETDDASSAKAYPIIECKSSGAPGTKLTSSTRSHFEKLESTAENDLQAFNREAICGATSRALVSKSNEIVDKSQYEKNLPVLLSQSNRKNRLISRKQKEKALSDGDGNVKFSSKEEEESRESIESCNSSGQFSTGKRLNFQQQLMVESKRIKRQTQEASVSNSLVKQDSSFMNWISNIMKGFSLSIQEARNCLAHTLAYPDHADQWPDQKLITFNRNQNTEPKNTGFQFIFESVHSPSLKRLEEHSKSFDLENKVHVIDATLVTCYAKNDTLYKQDLNLDEVERSRWIYETGSSSHPKNEAMNFANFHESSKSNSTANKDCSNLGLSKEREGKTSSSSLAGPKTNNTEYIDSSLLSERKEVDNSCYRNDTLGSQWIARFFPRPVSPLKISDHLIRSGVTQADSSDCSRLPHSQKHIAQSNKCKIEENHEEQSADEAKESQNHSINTEASNDIMGDKVDNSSMHINPMRPSQRCKNSEPVFSMFARRLDAIRYIISSNGTDKASKGELICLFCGTKGHQLCDCSETSGTELPDLLKKVKSRVGLDGLACFCIKCFRPNHWAISCPTSLPRGKCKLGVNALVNDCSPIPKRFTEGYREIHKLPTDDEGDQFLSGCAKNDEPDRIPEKTLNLKRKLNEVMTSDKIWSNVSIKKYIGSMRPPSCFVERKISDVPEKIFDAVKKLRLTRTDILKWISSHMSLSHLNGFYLRLRLGKWEGGLGRTGYYVASINEAHKQNSQQDTRTSLCVNVGGINCMVGSRYISNQEFLEEEIMAWWSTSSKSGIYSRFTTVRIHFHTVILNSKERLNGEKPVLVAHAALENERT
ncbi:uncharacterized protein LOC129309508 isoform X2 [Prosopis cineraria]|nr:uncharacterized protein LOC129309508 isoform X2 [Prosopis cineraria]XP_054807082.1 uncharacterized protein LOC129309508 isoform X2 [Prosopis cineraria]XP_054807083.1 uncharacterized protein LOC129309508 isoform X2 [Prosopis cineraria]